MGNHGQLDELTTWLEDGGHRWVIDQAFCEDLADGEDLTSQTMVSANAESMATLVARAPGRLAGLKILPDIATRFCKKDLVIEFCAMDGQTVEPGMTLVQCKGRLRPLLAMERTLLNFLCHLSGVATLTAKYVAQIVGTKARIFDTRKTLPGLRWLQKYAVRCGGGYTHRFGLYDAMLVKDNHIADIESDLLQERLITGIRDARQRYGSLRFIEVECDTLEQLQQVLTCGPDIVLLDNMPLDQLQLAVAMRDRLAPQVELEASGSVTLQAVAAIAQTGVDRISVGALTHSAPALDLALDIKS